MFNWLTLQYEAHTTHLSSLNSTIMWVVIGTAIVAALASGALVAIGGRRAGPLATTLRMIGGPLALTLVAATLIWAARSASSAAVSALLVVAVATTWVAFVVRAAIAISLWLTRRAIVPWRVLGLPEDGSDDSPRSVDRAAFRNRVEGEICRLKQGGQPGLTVVAAGRPGTSHGGVRNLLGQLEAVLPGHTLFHSDENLVLAILPDVPESELRTLRAELERTTADRITLGCAVYPDDGMTTDALIDSAVSHLWVDSGSNEDDRQLAPTRDFIPDAAPSGIAQAEPEERLRLDNSEIVELRADQIKLRPRPAS